VKYIHLLGTVSLYSVLAFSSPYLQAEKTDGILLKGKSFEVAARKARKKKRSKRSQINLEKQFKGMQQEIGGLKTNLDHNDQKLDALSEKVALLGSRVESLASRASVIPGPGAVSPIIPPVVLPAVPGSTGPAIPLPPVAPPASAGFMSPGGSVEMPAPTSSAAPPAASAGFMSPGASVEIPTPMSSPESSAPAESIPSEAGGPVLMPPEAVPGAENISGNNEPLMSRAEEHRHAVRNVMLFLYGEYGYETISKLGILRLQLAAAARFNELKRLTQIDRIDTNIQEEVNRFMKELVEKALRDSQENSAERELPSIPSSSGVPESTTETESFIPPAPPLPGSQPEERESAGPSSIPTPPPLPGDSENRSSTPEVTGENSEEGTRHENTEGGESHIPAPPPLPQPTSSASPRNDATAGGGSLLDQIQNFDPTNLRKRQASSQTQEPSIEDSLRKAIMQRAKDLNPDDSDSDSDSDFED